MSSLERYGDRETRIGTPERTAMTEILRAAVDQDYIDLDEYEKRVDVLLAAKTVGEAEVVLADLPSYQRLVEAAEPDALKAPDWVKWLWFGISIPIGINLGVWLILLATIGFVYFWPVWVMVPLLVVASSLTAAERLIMRPAAERKRREKLRRKRNQR
ncbi:DUF1707 domain-containing protein [Glycomyces sp. NPDC046736]|uniref:DUF1707 SHOCT-like domain-containing protein n=1 Tax=Glycomyces sp. NPDC046736 TaxID=3155615 RepID=UPI0033BFE631